MRPRFRRFETSPLCPPEYGFIAPLSLLVCATPCYIPAAQHLYRQRNGEPIRHREADEIDLALLGFLPVLQASHPVPENPQIFLPNLRRRRVSLKGQPRIVWTFSSTHHASKAPLNLIAKVPEHLKIGSLLREHHGTEIEKRAFYFLRLPALRAEHEAYEFEEVLVVRRTRRLLLPGGIQAIQIGRASCRERV